MKNCKVFQNSVYANKYNLVGNRFLFKLVVNYKEEKSFLQILDKYQNVIEKDIYWSFSIIKERLYKKLKYLAIINVHKNFINNKMHYKYYKISFYKLKDLKLFLIF